MLKVEDLTVAYATDSGPVVAVDHVDLELARGEFLAIVGESGCGKSTLLYAIARLLGSPLPGEIVGGRVLFKEKDLVLLEERELRRVRWRDLSVVMQSAMNALNPVLTVAEQMRDACRAHSNMSKREIEERSREVLRLVSIDPVHLHSYPHQLSGGMRQRAMIAMALLFTPDLVIMDEPTSALDVVAQRSLMVQIKELQERLGFAVIFVTHDMSLVSHFSDRLLVMYAGQVAELSKTRELFDRPRHPVLAGAARGVPLAPRAEGAAARHSRLAARPREPAGGMPLCGALPVRRTPLHRGRGAALRGERQPRPLRPAGEPAVTETLLRTEGLTRHFHVGKLLSRQSLHAVDDVDLTISRGEIVALVGESGSGKSTIARLLALRLPADPRRDLVRGQAAQPPARAAQQARLQRRRANGLPGSVQLDQPCVPDLARDPPRDEAPSRRPLAHRAPRRAEPRARRGRARAGQRDTRRRFPYELSGGQRQRVGFAQALALRPKLIVADEPVSMLDVSIRVGVLNLMGELREREGVSFLYITHDVASARYLADRVLVMYAGHLVEEGPTEEVLHRPKHPYTQLLVSAVPDPRAELGLADARDVGEPPKVIDPKPGCRFRARCPLAVAECETVTPLLRELGDGRRVACHVAS